MVDVVCDPKRGSGEDGSLADRLFFFSVHLFDSCRDCVEPDLYETLERGAVPHSSAAARRRPEAAQEEEWEFYPGTGAHDDVSKMVINAPLVPLWKKPSVQPKVPSPKRTRKKSPKVVEAKAAAAEMASEKASTPASTPVQHAGEVGGPRGRAGFKDQIRRRLIPALRAFHPDLVLLSSGFDGA